MTNADRRSPDGLSHRAPQLARDLEAASVERVASWRAARTTTRPAQLSLFGAGVDRMREANAR